MEPKVVPFGQTFPAEYIAIQVVVVYTGEYTASSCIKLEYNKFREEAINRKIVYIAEGEQDNTFLLIEKKGQIFKWSP